MIIPHIDARVVGCEAEVWFNDIPVLRLVGDRIPPFATRPVAEFLRGSANVLTVVPYPGPTPGTSRQLVPRPAPAEASIDVRLVLYNEGDFPGSGAGEDMITIALGSGASDPIPPRPVQMSTDGPRGQAPWAWEKAAVIARDPNVQPAVQAFVKAAHAAFAAGDAAFFIRHAAVKFAELAKAYPALSRQEREKRFRAGFIATAAAKPWQVAPLVPADFDFRWCAEGRLVELLDRRFQPVLRSESTFWPLRLYLGVLDSQLQVLR